MSSISNNARLYSLDALRGLDFLALFMGLHSVHIFHHLAKLFPDSSVLSWLSEQMAHVRWEGLHIYDCIFPLFVFISAIAMHYSRRKSETAGVGKGALLRRMWGRAGVLVALGWLVNGALAWDLQLMRYTSVLGLIGVSGAFAGSLSLLLKRPYALLSAASLVLLGVYLAQTFGGDMSPEGSVNARIDSALLPGRLWNGCYDCDGLLCVVSATGIALLGHFCGHVLSSEPGAGKRLAMLFCSGGALLLLGQVSGPIIRNLWTPSFALTVAGISFWLVGLFHVVVDLGGTARASMPLRVIGVNALFIYLLTHVIDFRALTWRVFGGTIRCLVPEDWEAFAGGCCFLLLAWLLCFYLWRRRIFIRV